MSSCQVLNLGKKLQTQPATFQVTGQTSPIKIMQEQSRMLQWYLTEKRIIRIMLNFSAEKNKNDTSNETHVHKHTHAVIQQEKWNISVQVHDFEI